MLGLEAMDALGMGPGRVLSSDPPRGLPCSPAGRSVTRAARASFLSSLAVFGLAPPAAAPSAPFWAGLAGFGCLGALGGAAELDASDMMRWGNRRVCDKS